MTRSFLAAVTALASAVCIASAEAAHITSVEPEMGPTAGSVSLTIRGLDFAPAGNSVMVGGRTCPITSEAADEVVCVLPEGTGASNPIRVVDGAGIASPPYPFAYSPPAITSVTAASAPTAGNVPITIIGQHFGASGSDRRVSVNGSAAGCNAALEVPHTQVVCDLPPGEGIGVPVEVTVDGQRSAASGLSYDPPAITAITPTRGPAAGGAIITIRGESFGSAAVVLVGASLCPIEVQTHDRIECELPPDGGVPPSVRVLASGQASNAVAFDYTQVASKCDAGKLKAAAGYAKCLGTAEANAAKKGLEPTAEALGKCGDKMATACAKAESSSSDCSQPGTCDALAAGTGRKGWDGMIYGNTR